VTPNDSKGDSFMDYKRGVITEITTFGPDLFPAFGLAPTL
jgi:hypothetical protein